VTFVSQGEPTVSIRDQILSSVDVQSEIVHIPEWGVDVEVRGMAAAERIAMYDAIATAQQSGKAAAQVAVMWPTLVIGCTYDPETGQQVFTNDDWTALAQKSGAAVDRIATTAMRLSGISEGSEDALGEGFSGSLNDAS
jgi:hypothetical protein